MSASLRNSYSRLEPWLILVSLAGLTSVTLSGLGSYKPFVYLAELLVLVHAARSLRSGPFLHPVVMWLAMPPAVFILCDALGQGHSGRYAVQNLVAFFVIAAAASTLPGRWEAGKRLQTGFLCIMVLISLAHVVTLWLYLEPVGPMDNPGLLSHNPHFITLQAMVVLLVMIHGWYAGGVRRPIAVIGIVGALSCIVLLESPVALTALGAAALAVGSVYLPKPLRLSVIVVAGISVLLLFVYPIFPEYFDGPLLWIRDVIGAPRLDARFQIWVDSWQMQLRASPTEWVVGHGLGGYEADLPGMWVFPHHFGLEVLYNSGILGLSAIGLASVSLGVRLAGNLRVGRRDLLLGLALLVGVGVFTFLTLPLTSSVTSHALGLVVGYCLWASKREGGIHGNGDEAPGRVPGAPDAR